MKRKTVTVMLSALCVLVVAVIGGFAASSVLSGGSSPRTQVHQSNQMPPPDGEEGYWTEERMRKAKPEPMPTVR